MEKMKMTPEIVAARANEILTSAYDLGKED